jgi:hypothetical protein
MCAAYKSYRFDRVIDRKGKISEVEFRNSRILEKAKAI